MPSTPIETVPAECLIFTPPRYTSADIDVISDELATWMAETLAKGEELCGWARPE